MSRSMAGYFLGLSLLCGFEVYALFIRQWGVPANIPPAYDRGLSREAAGEAGVGQTFVMHADGLYAVEVYPKPSKRPAGGPLVITLDRASPAGWIPIVRTERAASSVSFDAPLRLEIPRLDASAGEKFLLTLALPQATEGEGMMFETSGPRYVEGESYWFHRPSWGDLSFRAYAARATIVETLDARRRSWPAPFNLGVVWMALLAAINAAVAVMLYDLAVGPRQRTVRAHADQGPNGSEAVTADHPRV
jgi:hypothetical protein